MSFLLGLGCFGILPIVVCIVLIVLLANWLRGKTHRDELVLSLLGEIRETLDEIDRAMDERAAISRDDREKT